MKIKDGGALSNLVKTPNNSGKIESVRVEHANKRVFNLWINDDSLSYLSLEEMLDLRDEINEALKKVL